MDNGAFGGEGIGVSMRSLYRSGALLCSLNQPHFSVDCDRGTVGKIGECR